MNTTHPKGENTTTPPTVSYITLPRYDSISSIAPWNTLLLLIVERYHQYQIACIQELDRDKNIYRSVLHTERRFD